MADRFVRVRLARIEGVDLRVFDFDYDLTMMIFFVDAEQRVYARYGGRSANDPDDRQSLSGLRSTMKSVLQMHGSRDRRFAPRRPGEPLKIRDVPTHRNFGRCIHCHEAKEILNDQLRAQGTWTPALAFRYPPPENLGLELDISRSGTLADVAEGSAAQKAGLRPGDQILEVAGVPIHSYADVAFALDRAPERGDVVVSWKRDNRMRQGKLRLPDGWRRSDVSWRPSLSGLAASPRVYGPDLTAKEKLALGLAAQRLAFRQQDNLSKQAAAAGVRSGDVVLGFDGRTLEMTSYEFLTWVRRFYVKGERVQVDVLRDGSQLRLPMTLR